MCECLYVYVTVKYVYICCILTYEYLHGIYVVFYLTEESRCHSSVGFVVSEW